MNKRMFLLCIVFLFSIAVASAEVAFENQSNDINLFLDDNGNLNVTGSVFVDGSTVQVGGTDVCLENGTNCGNVNSTTFWSGVSGFVSEWFYDLGGLLAFNETHLNTTIDAKIDNRNFLLNNQSGTIAGSLTVTGNVTILGDAVVANVSQVNVNGSLTPSLNGLFDLGNQTNQWNNVYAQLFVGSLDWSNITNKPTLFGQWQDNGTFISAANNDSVVVTDTGRIGINTTTPNQALEVVGSANISNTLHVQQVVFEDNPANSLSDNATCIIINGPTSQLSIC